MQCPLQQRATTPSTSRLERTPPRLLSSSWSFPRAPRPSSPPSAPSPPAPSSPRRPPPPLRVSRTRGVVYGRGAPAALPVLHVLAQKPRLQPTMALLRARRRRCSSPRNPAVSYCPANVIKSEVVAQQQLLYVSTHNHLYSGAVAGGVQRSCSATAGRGAGRGRGRLPGFLDFTLGIGVASYALSKRERAPVPLRLPLCLHL
ncbi:hypothetical protein C8R46DRAFT_1104543 [Mycena filopes]|nr:hypothetical protein C8R46DRAFT_1104543 [Mycena filopes]